MADSYESYEVYINSDRKDEFVALLHERFGNAVELNWRDTIDI